MTDPSDARVRIVTGDARPELTDDGRAVAAELRRRGLAVEPAVWTDPGVDWTGVDAALLRSCWGYHDRFEAFRDWLAALEDAGVTLLNPFEAVRWNVHKFYLRDLAAEGVPVLPTAFVDGDADPDADLGAILQRRGWDEAVVKPAVGTSSAHAWRTDREAAGDDRARFASLLADRDVLVQRFAPEIRDGERSLVFLGGTFSHASRRFPAEGDFRAHPSFGATSEPYDPSGDVVEAAADVLRTARELRGVDRVEVPYARVDGVLRDGEFRLMELELVEPFLGLDRGDDAVEAFADAITAALDRRL